MTTERRIINSDGNMNYGGIKVIGGDNDGATIYLVGAVPTEGVSFHKEPDMPLDVVVDLTFEDIPSEKRSLYESRVRKILTAYDGRVKDASSVLGWSMEKNRFDEFAGRLERYANEIMRISPKARLARTDVTAFFMKAMLDLGTVEERIARPTIEFDKRYGPGFLTFPTVRVPENM